MKDCKSRENRLAISIVFSFKLTISYIVSVLPAVETNIIVRTPRCRDCDVDSYTHM